MSRYGEEPEDEWRVGEIRTFTVRNEDAGFVYEEDYTMTEDGKLFGPCNQRCRPIDAMTSRFRLPTR